MFSLMPFGFMFFFLIIFGSIFSLSSLHWLNIWMGLEINLMSFVPILIYRGTLYETESTMKYFIFQTLGSSMLMLGSLLSFKMSLSWEVTAMESPMGLLLLIFGLLMKLGSFPFHFWLPSVMASLSWLGCLILTTWQKLAPIFLLMTLIQSSPSNSKLMFLLITLASLSSLIGGIGGVGQTQIRALLAYSSIGHMGWMIFCSTFNHNVLKMYFLIYFISSICIFIILWSYEMTFFNQAGEMSPEKSNLYKMSLIIMLLSIGGMPPFLGFVGKLLAIWSCSSTASLMAVSLMLMGSLISLFYYLSFLFSAIFLSGSNLTGSDLTTLKFNPASVKELDTLISFDHCKSKMQSIEKMIIMILIINSAGGLLIYFTLPILDFM